MKYHSLFFSLKVWLSSVFIAPLIYSVLVLSLTPGKSSSFAGFAIYPVMILFELIFSFITWLIFWAVTVLISTRLKDWRLRKYAILFSGIILTIGTFLLFLEPGNTFSFDDIFFDMMLCNCFCIGAGCWLF